MQKRILLIVLWFAVGFITMVFAWILDMRNKPFNKDYFDTGIFSSSVLVLVSGFVAPFALCIAYITEKKLDLKYKFTELIYKISNFKIKKDK